jgi:hypothetical protein
LRVTVYFYKSIMFICINSSYSHNSLEFFGNFFVGAGKLFATWTPIRIELNKPFSFLNLIKILGIK